MNLQRSLDEVRRHIDAGDIRAAEAITADLRRKRCRNTDLQFLQGCIQFMKGNYGDAIRLFRCVLDKDPDYLGAYLNLGVALNESNRPDEALPYIRKISDIQPRNVLAHYNLGNVYHKLRRLPEAKSSYLQTIAIDPDYGPVYTNLGFVCYELDEVPDALRYFRKAVEFEPGDRSYTNLMALLRKKKSPQAYLHALEVLHLPHPGGALAYAHTLLVEACRWDLAERVQDDMISIATGDTIRTGVLQDILLTLNCCPSLDNRTVFAIHRRWGGRASAGRSPYTEFPNALAHTRKLRIGYLSGDFCHHSVGLFIRNVISTHDPERFEIICYSSGKTRDSVTQEIRAAAHDFVDVRGLPPADLARRIHRDGIHVLVDLAGHTTDTGVEALSYRPAPVQITYLGYPNTTGLATVDYRITDPHADTEGGTLYTEELLRMPESFLCFGCFEERPIEAAPPALRNGYVTFGSFNNTRKLTPAVIRAWSEILQRVPRSRLLLKAGKVSIDYVRENITNEFAKHGIGAERLDLRGHVKATVTHLDLYNQVDIALDTFPYNGTTTTCEALWMGVPVITRVGKAHAQRVSYSILMNIGIPDTVTHSDDEYVARAVSLANALDELEALRTRIPQALRSSVLCRPVEFTRQLEDAYCTAWIGKGHALPSAFSGARAVQATDRAASRSKDPQVALIGLAQGHLREGRRAAAEENLREALRRNPGDLLALFLLGTVCYQQRDYAAAIELLSKVVGEDPGNASAHMNLGAALADAGRYDEALGHYRRALAIEPANHIALNNLGNLLKERGRLDDARLMLERSVVAQPDYWPANLNLGSVHSALHDDGAALQWFRKACALQREPAVYAALIMTLKKTGNYQEAYHLAVEVLAHPDPGVALLPAYNVFQAVCDWERRYAAEEKLLALIDNRALENAVLQSCLLALNSSCSLSPGEIFALHRAWGERESRLYRPYRHYPRAGDPRRRLKIGYLSPDFRRHSVGYFIRNLLVAHDRERVEVHCYSNSAAEDEITAEIKAAVYSFVAVQHMNGDELAKRIHDDGIDILIDLAGHTTDSRVAVLCFRPAPIQITYLGYPNTTGLNCVDYRISDPYADTGEGGTIYTEELVCLPQSFLCIGRLPELRIDPEPPLARTGFVTFGSFNNLNKMTPEVVRVWAGIMGRVPGSRLILKAERAGVEFIQEHVYREFAKYAITRDRIDMLPFTEGTAAHLDLYNNVDIALDTFPYNGATTTCEALWMGVPVVTLVGGMHVQRVGYSILRNIGIAETIAHTEGEYLEVCARLAGDAQVLRDLRARIPGALRGSILCDPERFARQFEQMLVDIWRRAEAKPLDSAPSGSVPEPPARCAKDGSSGAALGAGLAPPAQAPVVEQGAWPDQLRKFDYAIQLSARWLRYLEVRHSDEAWLAHQWALDHYAAACRAGSGSTGYIAHLRQAYWILFRLADIKGNASNLQSLARIATALGEYEVALHALYYIAKQFDGPAQVDLDEPFIVACSRYDEVNPQENIEAWVYCAVLEQTESLEQILSRAVPQSTRDRIEKIRAMGFLDEAVASGWTAAYGTGQRREALSVGGADGHGAVSPGHGERRLHIGGKQEHPDWEIFNAVPAPCVDHIGNAKDLSRFADGTFTEIYGSHVLEHFDYARELKVVLREWHRVLKPGGRLYISVPDLDKLAELVLMKDKLNVEQRFQVMRMMFGGEVDEYDYHKVGLNRDFLEKFLREAGFKKMTVVDSLGLFDDTSDYRPYGHPISLNLIAEK